MPPQVQRWARASLFQGLLVDTMIGQNGLGTVLCTTSMNAEPAMDQKQMGTSTAWASSRPQYCHDTESLDLQNARIVESQSFKGKPGKAGSQNYSHYSNRVPCGARCEAKAAMEAPGRWSTWNIAYLPRKLHRARQPKKAAKWTTTRMAMRVKLSKP